jgi:Zn-dependent protease
MRSFPFAIILLAAGAALLFWGIAATDSVSSNASEFFQGAPSNKAISLMVIGGIMAGLGLLSLVRRPAAN